MESEDYNRLGPVKPERIDALERRIEELEARCERLETIASMQPEPQHGDVRVGTAANDLSQALIVDGESFPPDWLLRSTWMMSWEAKRVGKFPRLAFQDWGDVSP